MHPLLDRLDQAATRIETDHAHGKTVARLWGADKGQTIVLLHGSFGGWSHWVRNIEALSAKRKVLAVDLPGMGESDAPPEPITAESMGAIVAECLEDALAPGEHFELAGFSFGGIVGGQTVLRLEDRVDRFSVLGSNALDLKIDVRKPMRSPRSDMSDAELREVHRHNLGVFMFGDPANVDDLALDLQGINTRRARRRSGQIPRGDSLKRALQTMQTPVRGIWGALDATAGRYLQARQDLFDALPHSDAFHVIPGAGHWVAYEAADAVNRILLD